ncbi:coatomer subunit alpha-1 [Eurytemora carolleeae]|uniref:coatomer subunit alpha-1 n=1 Tax=Eurytemora carolleeae TaxID=1294199 RepID=UPI000C779478|nr:coatomer subunit alpha-1 [Eurytemora carolleeae]|eukprot:XP_023320040.1 coatomer subunit alpha-1-like [Eurytemora affinis]
MYWKYSLEESGVLCNDIHSTRPWILVGFRSGYASINDYETQEKRLDLKTHAGPVRSISFHPTLSLFLTGSDDCTVKVWNYETQRCTVVFKGHLDYVRKVIFHKVYPWVISCSDDSTIRFWNWMSRDSLCTVTGHIHWVTDIDIHYERDILISCSVDNTVRVWDFSSLRNRTAKRLVAAENTLYFPVMGKTGNRRRARRVENRGNLQRTVAVPSSINYISNSKFCQMV